MPRAWSVLLLGALLFAGACQEDERSAPSRAERVSIGAELERDGVELKIREGRCRPFEGQSACSITLAIANGGDDYLVPGFNLVVPITDVGT